MRISVVIPVYNGEHYLAEAIESVLNQTIIPYEIVVVDDGSTDSSPEILSSYGERIRVVCQENAGTAAARNAGVLESTGAYLAFLDQDDYWEENKLLKQAKVFSESPETQLVWGSVQQFISSEMPVDFKRRYRCQQSPLAGYLPSSLLIRRKAFETIGLFDTRWRIGEWADWYARCQHVNLASEHVTDVVTFRRIHEGNKGITMSEDRGEYLELIRENMKCRREN